ncbi:ACR3 family arsenite efflux pump ArsB [Cerasibacillus quisquiliarum]|uniref:Arsenite transporter n=1 Tax=Cerasibacillus quisquiliarum TaxID=227865 RepID=A0A511V0J9_9BACI|nr:bile acid:sodium symporter [Cerasibacillus quisquiliarum]MBB5147386.1 ACR3 family arsenite efflux pump ArsB [Cerasibacillus quisquiliarum]GEN32437.1 arsenite transporter [Cerasibacillus quisquiliarum]
MKKLYRFPQKHIMLSVPLILVLGFIIGSFVDTSFLRPTILIATMVMIYATMVGLDFNELKSLKGSKTLFISIIINFIIIPFVAYGIGMTFLKERPIMFAGLALSALLPTSGMTISWTMLQRGNVTLAVKLTIFGLLLGSLLAPWYLLLMVGQFIDINIWATVRTILLIVFIPMILGQITYKLILRKTSVKHFKKHIKPNFAPLSVWGMLYVVFVSISMRAKMIVSNLELILIALIVLIVFYGINYLISTTVAVKWLNREDGIALVNGTVLRNLSISIGLAATTFGAEAALIVTLAFIVQQQSITYYSRVSEKFWFKEEHPAWKEAL